MPRVLAPVLFPPRNPFPSNLPQAFPNCPHLCPPSRDPESTETKCGLCRAQRTVRTLPACHTLFGDRGGWVNGAVGDIFIFKPGCLIPGAPCRNSDPIVLAGQHAEATGWWGLAHTPLSGPRLPQPFGPPCWSVRSADAAACFRQACSSTPGD